MKAERLLLQYRVAFGLVLLGIVLAIGVVVRAYIKIHVLAKSAPRAQIVHALASGRAYVDVAVVLIVLGMLAGVVTTLQSQPPRSRRPRA